MKLRLPIVFIFVFLIFLVLVIPASGSPVLKPDTHNPEGVTSTYLPIMMAMNEEGGWSMAAANPERTSWTPEEIKGHMKAEWFKPIEPYILPRVQIIAANDLLYLSTSRGLYAIDAATGDEKWVYPTELPLGHSPTVDKGVVYVGGFDRTLHAIDSLSGVGLWTFEAGAGFDTNPLVIGGKVYAGNRDGFFYAIHVEGPDKGQLAWRYETGGPIHFSAAYTDGNVYFASNDSHAYALDAQSGNLIWKSDKLPGAGFHSWWPVVYEDYVIFAGSNNYRFSNDLGPGTLIQYEKTFVYPNYQTDPKGTLVGPIGQDPGGWAEGTTTIDASKSEITSNGATTPITEYFEQYPWRRTYFVLNRLTGEEYVTDFDNDGLKEYAPILEFGTHGAGNRYPPVVASDGVLYQTNNYMSDPAIPGGQISGWQIGTPFISIVSIDWGAIDEPHAYSVGGNTIYWSLCCDRQVGSFDVSAPNTLFAERYNNGVRPPTGGAPDWSREWFYVGYNLDQLIPGYNSQYYGSPNSVFASFGGQNGIYGYHGDQTAPIPYKGRVYIHRGNSIIAFAPDVVSYDELPPAQIVPAPDSSTPIPVGQLENMLASEVQKILDAGHLRPGYSSVGIFDLRAGFNCGDGLIDYWHHPWDILNTLIRALPRLSPQMQTDTLAYIQSEYNAYPPYQYNHIGWRDGAAREPFDLPPETETDRASFPPATKIFAFDGWSFGQHSFYTLWKYAELFGDAQTIFDLSKDNLESPPSNDILMEMAHVHNAYIAGYIGYLELEELAGYPKSTDVEQELTRLINLRISTFSKDAPSEYFDIFQKYYCRTINVSRNFMYLVPELADILRNDANAFAEVQAAMDEYETIAPYWFVSKAEATFGEGIQVPFHDYHAIFQAKALMLTPSYEDIVKYIDVPAVEIGDLFYMDNLITAIEIGSQ